jgi:hypothetical protein
MSRNKPTIPFDQNNKRLAGKVKAADKKYRRFEKPPPGGQTSRQFRSGAIGEEFSHQFYVFVA